MTDPDDTTTCRSCGRQTQSRARWSPVIIKGEVVGHTCAKCPQHGEPITRLVNGAGVRFRVRLTIGLNHEGRQRWETQVFPTLGKAREHVESRGAEIKKERQRGQLIVDHSRMTVSDLIELWLMQVKNDPDVRVNTFETYTHRVKPIRRHIGAKRVQALRKRDVQEFYGWMRREGGRWGQPLGEHSARGCLMALKQMFRYAVDESIISANPTHSVKLPRVGGNEHTEHERWTAAEWFRFQEHVVGDDLAHAWLLISLGLRREEVLGIDWSSVDFNAGTITIRRTRVKVSKSTDPNGWVTGPVKTHRSKRNASLRTLSVDEVIPGTLLALRRLWFAAGRPETGFVVVDSFGEPVSPDSFSDKFAALCREVEVPEINVHSARHTLAYLMNDWGIPPVRAAAWLGHDVQTYLSIYLFSRKEDNQTTASEIGKARLRAAAGA